ncbi:MAG: hypothetical protein MJE63_00175 [Proteobacteria bacterium]|nr:hypothetical protein [Pseudomonadota bacterium]
MDGLVVMQGVLFFEATVLVDDDEQPVVKLPNITSESKVIKVMMFFFIVLLRLNGVRVIFFTGG